MIKLGITQIKSSTDIDENMNSIMQALAHFESSDVDLVFFPECSLSGFSGKIKECTLELLNPYLDRVEQWARQHQKHVVLPTAIVEGDKIYNSGFIFKPESKQRFYKTGLTESEVKFFSLPEAPANKIFNIKGYNLALIICYEAELGPWKYFAQGEADIILWPGYWGWNEGDSWGELKNETEPNLIYQNNKSWKLPIIQANFAFNDLSDYRASGPHGMSMFVNSDNSLAGCGELDSESCYEIHIEGREIVYCEKTCSL